MRLQRQKVPVKKVRVMVLELEGNKVLKTKTISVYESNHSEVFGVVEKALSIAAHEGVRK